MFIVTMAKRDALRQEGHVDDGYSRNSHSPPGVCRKKVWLNMETTTYD